MMAANKNGKEVVVRLEVEETTFPLGRDRS